MPSIVAIAAVWVSVQQYKIAEAKLKLDLYDRRMAVYEGFQELIEVVTLDSLTAQNLGKFRLCVRQAGFLFGADVIDFLGEVEKKYSEILKISHRIRLIKSGGSPGSLPQAERELDEELDAFFAQGKTGFDVFFKYLAIDR
ncbi:hypothetical protein RT95_07370 [Xanthomonas campestris]|nr:hypothetical protein RT95_07370 [Xanthomonas campestris]